MAPRVPKGNHRDPFVKTVLPKPTHRGSSQQPLLLSATDYRKALDGHDAPLSTCYLFFISFFFYACGASLVMIQNVCVARNAPTPTALIFRSVQSCQHFTRRVLLLRARVCQAATGTDGNSSLSRTR